MGSQDLSRRAFLKYGIVATGAVVLGPELARTGQTATDDTLKTPAYTISRRGARPTRIDAHGHTVPGLTADRVISLMDHAGISHMVLMAMGRNDPLTAEIYKQYPQRILPFVSSMYPAWHRQDERVLSYVEKQLRTGNFMGVGEVMLRYYGIPSKNEPETNVPADSPFMKKLADIVEYHNAVMLVHMEPEPEAIRSLENLLDYNKKLRLIWAHCGTVARVGMKTIGHFNIATLMDRHPNLYTDMAGVQPSSVAPEGGLRRPSITDDHGKLFPEFRDILKKHSDRVLFGLDTPWKECWAEKPFKRWVHWADQLVGQLNDSHDAVRIMHKNAEELFNI
jgi:predicted TIM-barrel fold metal-dependent hydrolase